MANNRALVTPQKQGKRVIGNPDKIIPYRYKPGQSGNPSGRPKNDVAREIAKAIFENNREGAYNALAKALMKGSAQVFKELADRAYGKVTEKHELTGKEGGPLGYRELSEAELKERIKQLEGELGLTAAIDDAGRGAVVAARAAKTGVASETQ